MIHIKGYKIFVFTLLINSFSIFAENTYQTGNLNIVSNEKIDINKSVKRVNTLKENIPLPTQAQLNWQDAEVTAVFHFGIPIMGGK